ncbi:hypothetical protein FOZ60_013272 [Perkinsus olseni]|uniref:Uncharacterized protein n=1 Tax=Perkinsus olseni TaxID=32597 RepID=A0A7J6NCB9_PEROL|nr:hypothetical protein FOZ60_013272 [Perkinsus olseni]
MGYLFTNESSADCLSADIEEKRSPKGNEPQRPFATPATLKGEALGRSNCRVCALAYGCIDVYIPPFFGVRELTCWVLM